jgi:hypothetical protein
MHAKINQIFSNKVNVEYILNAILVKIVDNTPTIIKATHKTFTIALDLLNSLIGPNQTCSFFDFFTNSLKSS